MKGHWDTYLKVSHGFNSEAKFIFLGKSQSVEIINKITGNNNKEEFQQVKLDVRRQYTHTSTHTYMKDNGRNQCYVHSSAAIMG